MVFSWNFFGVTFLRGVNLLEFGSIWTCLGSWIRIHMKTYSNPKHCFKYTVPKMIWFSAYKPSLSWLERMQQTMSGFYSQKFGPETRNVPFCCICSNRNKLGCNAENRIIFGTVYIVYTCKQFFLNFIKLAKHFSIMNTVFLLVLYWWQIIFFGKTSILANWIQFTNFQFTVCG